jgi:uncharacterized membrane protein (UPF0136 family)
MHMPFPTLVLWIYIILLFIGGLVGFLKAGSKASLIMSASFAGILALCATNAVFQPNFALILATIVLIFLMVFFSIRVTKSKKFMPNGLMAVLTLVTLVLRHIPTH